MSERIAKSETELQSGAADALRYVSEKEKEARAIYDKAQNALDLALQNQREKPPETDGEDYEKRVKQAIVQKEEAFDSWKKWADMLHKFDKSVPESKRDTSDRISREDNERFIFLLGIHIREAKQRFMTKFSQEVLKCQKPEEVSILIDPIVEEIVKGAVDSGVRESHLPPWFKAAVEEAF